MYTVADLSATSAPLPERRLRVWIVGSRCNAASWAALAVHLENVCVAKPRHHMDHLLVPKAPKVRPAAATKSKEDPGQQWAKDAAYHKHFSEGLQKALDAKRLPEDTVPPDMGKRPSRRPENNKMTAAQAGSLDVYSMIIAAAQDTGDTKYADITQATHRGQVVLHGVVKTLATSTRLYDLKTFSYIKPERHLAILGYGPDLKLDLVTVGQCYEPCWTLQGYVAFASPSRPVQVMAAGSFVAMAMLARQRQAALIRHSAKSIRRCCCR